MDNRSEKILITFKMSDIQDIVNKIQRKAKKTDLMRVEVFEDYHLEVRGVFRGCSTSEEFYTTTVPLSDELALEYDLAKYLIEISL